MITNREKFSLTYFLTNNFFLASGYSLIFNTSLKDSWLSMIIGSIIGMLFIYLFSKYIINKKFKKNIFIETIFYSSIIFIDILVLRIFTTSFLLYNTPGIVITIPFILLSLYAANKGIKTISRIAEILAPISIFLIIINILFIIKDGSIMYFLPLINTSISKIFIGSLYFAIFTSIPSLLLINIKVNTNKLIKNYVKSSLITIFIGTVIIYILGPKLITIFRFPEYMVLKQLKIFNFVEKIENIVSLIWLFNLFITISLCLYNIKLTINNNNILQCIIIGLIIYLSEYVSTNYTYANYIYKNLPIIILVLGLVFSLSILANKKRKQ